METILLKFWLLFDIRPTDAVDTLYLIKEATEGTLLVTMHGFPSRQIAVRSTLHNTVQ